jgi:hypothetical protein
MKKDLRLLLGVQANRLLIGNEVHLVPACRQLDAELGPYDSAAAVRWIASDADFHGFAFRAL